MSVKALAEKLNTSMRSVYRMLQDGLEYYDIPGGIKISDEQLKTYLDGKRKSHSHVIERRGITYPSSEGERAFIEFARSRRRGGARKASKPRQ
jgi:hypothetical protein